MKLTPPILTRFGFENYEPAGFVEDANRIARHLGIVAKDEAHAQRLAFALAAQGPDVFKPALRRINFARRTSGLVGLFGLMGGTSMMTATGLYSAVVSGDYTLPKIFATATAGSACVLTVAHFMPESQATARLRDVLRNAPSENAVPVTGEGKVVSLRAPKPDV